MSFANVESIMYICYCHFSPIVYESSVLPYLGIGTEPVHQAALSVAKWLGSRATQEMATETQLETSL